MNTLIRDSCPVCGSAKFDTIYEINDFPVFMGTFPSHNNQKLYLEDLTYCSCEVCDSIFIKQLVDPSLLYMHNHNAEIVGTTWANHYSMLQDFICLGMTPGTKVLEIGDPSAKLATECCKNKNIESWKIVEPNPTLQEHNSKIEIHAGWIDDYDYSSYNHDIVVMSHCFEHLFHPREFLSRLSQESAINSKIIISIPHLEHILEKGFLSPAGLSFEHTFYYNDELIQYIFEKCGWRITRRFNFKNHSIFIEAVNTQELCDKEYTASSRINRYKTSQIFKRTEELIDSLNKKMAKTSDDVYIFGGHIQTQFFLYMGLKQDKIKNILDNANRKIGNRLYGTDLDIVSPQSLNDKGSCDIICYMSIYTDEIKKGILNINESVRFL